MALSGSRCIVTGAAGFIGSHLAEKLLALDCNVIGIDSFTDYYPRRFKEANLQGMYRHTHFSFLEADLANLDLPDLLSGADYVFHQAAQAGVRASWSDNFARYVHCNVLTTQRLLEAARDISLERFVYASSSSVYGNTPTLPMNESALPCPVSPYGVTKLAGEHLCHLYHENFGVPAVSLRYFTVYGPRQRPDMAFHKFIRAALSNRPIALYGDGKQSRDVTYVSDIVGANLLAAERGQPGRIYNVGGGSAVTILEVIATIERILGRPIPVDLSPVQAGDVEHTLADCSAARAIGFAPCVGIEAGLRAEVGWLRETMLADQWVETGLVPSPVVPV